MIRKQIKSFLSYLTLEKKYSSNTIRAYETDLNSFMHFINKDPFFNINTKEDLEKAKKFLND